MFFTLIYGDVVTAFWVPLFYKFNEKRNIENVESDHVPSAAVESFRNFTATKA